MSISMTKSTSQTIVVELRFERVLSPRCDGKCEALANVKCDSKSNLYRCDGKSNLLRARSVYW